MTKPVLSLSLLVVFFGCASATFDTGPVAEIPQFDADDERVETAGFVAETLRLNHERDGRRFTLMAFVIGDRLTLGAMVKGSFHGRAVWQVAGRPMSVALATDGEESRLPVECAAMAEEQLVGLRGSFRGITWVNIEMPAAWLPDGGELQLAFVDDGDDGGELVMPSPGFAYQAQFVGR